MYPLVFRQHSYNRFRNLQTVTTDISFQPCLARSCRLFSTETWTANGNWSEIDVNVVNTKPKVDYRLLANIITELEKVGAWHKNLLFFSFNESIRNLQQPLSTKISSESTLACGQIVLYFRCNDQMSNIWLSFRWHVCSTRVNVLLISESHIPNIPTDGKRNIWVVYVHRVCFYIKGFTETSKVNSCDLWKINKNICIKYI